MVVICQMSGVYNAFDLKGPLQSVINGFATYVKFKAWVFNVKKVALF